MMLVEAVKQGVALTGHNRTGLPYSIGRPTVYAPGGRPAPRRQLCRRQTTDARDRY